MRLAHISAHLEGDRVRIVEHLTDGSSQRADDDGALVLRLAEVPGDPRAWWCVETRTAIVTFVTKPDGRVCGAMPRVPKDRVDGLGRWLMRMRELGTRVREVGRVREGA